MHDASRHLRGVLAFVLLVAPPPLLLAEASGTSARRAEGRQLDEQLAELGRVHAIPAGLKTGLPAGSPGGRRAACRPEKGVFW